MPREAYKPTERRPIASRERRISQRLAAYLVACRVSPKGISIAGLLVGIAAGVMLGMTRCVDSDWLRRMLWFAAAIGIQLRLLANMLDGMVAVASGKASPLGELYNELPDRLSDMAILMGAGYATGGLPALGYIAACVAILTAYVRAVGKAAGVLNLFVGPMAKPQRMFVMTLVALLMTVFPRAWEPAWGVHQLGLAALGLAVVIVGGLATVLRRLTLIVRHLKGQK